MRTHTSARTFASVLAAGSLAVSLVATAAPAHAEPVPDAERLEFDLGRVAWHYWPDTTIVTGVHPVLSRAWTSPQPGTTVSFVVTSCGRTLREESMTTTPEQPEAAASLYLSPNDEFSETAYGNEITRLVGPTVEVTATVTHPGYDPYTLSAVVDVKARIPDIPSCARIDRHVAHGFPEIQASEVRSWSRKRSLPVVGTDAVSGRRAKISPTTLRRGSGAKVTYTWVVGRFVRSRSRVATFDARHVGKPVKVVVEVKEPGKKSLVKTLGYGKVRTAP